MVSDAAVTENGVESGLKLLIVDWLACVLDWILYIMITAYQPVYLVLKFRKSEIDREHTSLARN